VSGLQFRVRYQAGPKARHWGAWKVSEFDYTSGTYGAVERELTFSARRSGLCHGFCFWFDSQLTETIKLSSSPWLPHSERANIYGVAACLWEKPVPLQKKQSYRLQIRLSDEGLISVQLKQESSLGQLLPLAKFDETPSPQNFSEYCPPLAKSLRGHRLDITQKLSQEWPPAKIQKWLMEEYQMSHQESHQKLFECLNFLQTNIRYPQEQARFRWQNLDIEVQCTSKDLLSQALNNLNIQPLPETEPASLTIKLDHCSYRFGWRYKLQVPRGERLFESWSELLNGLREELEWLSSESAPEAIKVRAKLQGETLTLVDEESWLQLNETAQVSAISPQANWKSIQAIEFGNLPSDSLQHRVAKLFSHCKFPPKSNPLAFCRQLLEQLEARR